MIIMIYLTYLAWNNFKFMVQNILDMDTSSPAWRMLIPVMSFAGPHGFPSLTQARNPMLGDA